MEAIAKLRERLKWTQYDLAPKVGRKHGTVRLYEAGMRVPAPVLKRLAEIAAEHGFTDLAEEFSAPADEAGKTAESTISPTPPDVLNSMHIPPGLDESVRRNLEECAGYTLQLQQSGSALFGAAAQMLESMRDLLRSSLKQAYVKEDRGRAKKISRPAAAPPARKGKQAGTGDHH